MKYIRLLAAAYFTIALVGIISEAEAPWATSIVKGAIAAAMIALFACWDAWFRDRATKASNKKGE